MQKKFDDVLKWFHQNHTGEDMENRIPPKVRREVCLFDVYKLIVNMGGYVEISKEDNWDEVAMSFGYPEEYGQSFEDMYDVYLLHAHSFYTFAKDDKGFLSGGNETGWKIDHIKTEKGDGYFTPTEVKKDTGSKVREKSESKEGDPSIEEYCSGNDEDYDDTGGSKKGGDYVIV